MQLINVDQDHSEQEEPFCSLIPSTVRATVVDFMAVPVKMESLEHLYGLDQ